MKLSRSPIRGRRGRSCICLWFCRRGRCRSCTAGAAVRAAGHACGEDFVLEAQVLDFGFELVHDVRQDAFALGHRQTASGQGGAGHRPAADGRVILGELSRCGGAASLQAARGHSGSISQKMMLWWGVRRIGNRIVRADFAEGRFQLHGFGVFDAAVLDVEAVEPLAVALLVPAHAVVEAVHADGSQRFERIAEVLFDFAAEAVDAPIVNEVLHAGDFAVGPVAEVALHFHDRNAQIDHARGVDVAHRNRDGGKCFLGAGRDAEAAADEDVVADDVEVLGHREEADVVGVDVDAVVAGKADGDFELARQVGFAVDRFDRVVAGHWAAGRAMIGASPTAPTSMLSPVSASLSQI